MTKTVVVLRGIPGSGKSTLAREMLGENPDGSVVRINNDEIVGMLFGTNWRRQPGIAELLQATRESLLKTYLQSPLVETIIIDNTNLQKRTVSSIQKIALRFGAKFVVDDSLLYVPVETCIERDALRAVPVGADVIRKMAKDVSKLGPWKYPDYEVPVIKEYENNSSPLPTCYIFDIDGTLALNNGSRDIYDESRVGNDSYNYPVWMILASLYANLNIDAGDRIIFMSGRHDSCREDTTTWLDKYWGQDSHKMMLYMRPTGDDRPDYIVKYELFQEQIAGKFFVAGAFDDRDQIVDLWRNKLGLPTFQVANGDF